VVAARKFGIAHELLDVHALRKRFPHFLVKVDEVGYLERDAGFLRPEACIAAQLALARRHGAELHANERVVGIEERPDCVQVATERGHYVADRLVVTAGAWLPSLIDDYERVFRVYRQVLFWFALDAAAEGFAPQRFPVFIWELQKTRQGIYGFPAIDGAAGGLKIATESYAGTTTPDQVERAVGNDEIESMFSHYVAPHFAGLAQRCVKSAVCLYTVTPDFGFVIDWLPGSDRTLIASACSGHGFKHSATIGEILAQTIVGHRSEFDLAPFRFKRFVA